MSLVGSLENHFCNWPSYYSKERCEMKLHYIRNTKPNLFLKQSNIWFIDNRSMCVLEAALSSGGEEVLLRQQCA